MGATTHLDLTLRDQEVNDAIFRLALPSLRRTHCPPALKYIIHHQIAVMEAGARIERAQAGL